MYRPIAIKRYWGESYTVAGYFKNIVTVSEYASDTLYIPIKRGKYISPFSATSKTWHMVFYFCPTIQKIQCFCRRGNEFGGCGLEISLIKDSEKISSEGVDFMTAFLCHIRQAK